MSDCAFCGCDANNYCDRCDRPYCDSCDCGCEAIQITPESTEERMTAKPQTAAERAAEAITRFDVDEHTNGTHADHVEKLSAIIAREYAELVSAADSFLADHGQNELDPMRCGNMALPASATRLRLALQRVRGQQ